MSTVSDFLIRKLLIFHELFLNKNREINKINLIFEKKIFLKLLRKIVRWSVWNRPPVSVKHNLKRLSCVYILEHQLAQKGVKGPY